MHIANLSFQALVWYNDTCAGWFMRRKAGIEYMKETVRAPVLLWLLSFNMMVGALNSSSLKKLLFPA